MEIYSTNRGAKMTKENYEKELLDFYYMFNDEPPTPKIFDEIGKVAERLFANVSKHEGIDHELRVMPKIADTDWMPVEDLPDDNSGYYLCYTKYIYNDDKPQYFYETARIEDRQWYAPNGENITDNVIYWKELPKAPH